jgi:methylenetetrahydrofolate reductase (NADPH)
MLSESRNVSGTSICEAEARRIPASIEISLKQALDWQGLGHLFPAGTSVYITDITPAPSEVWGRAARRVRQQGFEPVPHFAARRLTSKAALEERVAALAGEAGVRDVLVIGGAAGKSDGDFTSALDVLETGCFERRGVRRIGVAGHPEGSPDFSEEIGFRLLKLKHDFGERSGADMRVVTQFGFDPMKFISWAEGLRTHGIDLPVHIGVSGPARITELLKYAAACGVGSSIDFLRKQAGKLTVLVAGYSPESFVGPVENHWRDHPDPIIRQIHVFAFGGVNSASTWLTERGSWPR